MLYILEYPSSPQNYCWHGANKLISAVQYIIIINKTYKFQNKNILLLAWYQILMSSIQYIILLKNMYKYQTQIIMCKSDTIQKYAVKFQLHKILRLVTYDNVHLINTNHLWGSLYEAYTIKESTPLKPSQWEKLVKLV